MAKNSSIKVGAIQTHVDDMLLPMGLNLSSVDVVGHGVHLTAHPFTVTLDRKASFVAKLKSSDLASFLTAKGPGGLKNFTVTAVDGELKVEATKTILVEVPVKATCKLRLHGNSQIFVELISLDVMGSGAKNFVQAQFEKINPVLDADEFPFDTHFEHISIADGHVIVEGKMAPKG